MKYIYCKIIKVFALIFAFQASATPEDLCQRTQNSSVSNPELVGIMKSELYEIDKITQTARIQNDDVHAFNRVIGSKAHNYVELCHKILKPSEMTHFEDSFKRLEMMLQNFHDAVPENTHQAIQQLKDYFSKGLDVDNETKINVQALFHENIEFLNRLKAMNEDLYFCFLSTLIIKLDENFSQKGGCFPGYAGRLFEIYMGITEALATI